MPVEKQNINWLQITLTAAAIILAFLIGCGNNDGGFFSCNKGDTVSVKIDTTINTTKDSIQYVPVLVEVIDTLWLEPKPPPPIHDTIETFEIRIDPVDTPAILKRFFDVAIYSDTPAIKSRGRLIIKDTVTQNRIYGRGVYLTGTDTTIEKTVTLTQPKRLIGYVGFSAFGNRYNLLKAVGVDFSLKGKNDVIYGIGAVYMSDTILRKGGNLYYEAQAKFPIRTPFSRNKK